MNIQELLILFLILLAVVVPIAIFLFPVLRWYLRTWRSARWPQVTAVVHVAGAEYMEGSEAEIGYNRSLFGYSYLVNGERYAGFFAFAPHNMEEASLLQRKLEGQPITIRYNPARPSISVLADRQIEGLRAMQTPQWVRPGTDLQQMRLASLKTSKPKAPSNR